MDKFTEFFCTSSSDQVHETLTALVEFSAKHEKYLELILREKKKKQG